MPKAMQSSTRTIVTGLLTRCHTLRQSRWYDFAVAIRPYGIRVVERKELNSIQTLPTRFHSVVDERRQPTTARNKQTAPFLFLKLRALYMSLVIAQRFITIPVLQP